ncbi:MAG: hypothetical protein IPH20_23275 [Bacteroidales bacterium]|nr:hypothetical protein [Bacteroidales bacterium]
MVAPIMVDILPIPPVVLAKAIWLLPGSALGAWGDLMGADIHGKIYAFMLKVALPFMPTEHRFRTVHSCTLSAHWNRSANRIVYPCQWI